MNTRPSPQSQANAAAIVDGQHRANAVSLATYQALVDRCAEKRLDQNISNGSPFHARILIAKLFEVARKNVRIVSGRLLDATVDGICVYGHEPVIEQARNFLRDPSSKLTIIIQDGQIDHGNENSFLRQLVQDAGRNGTIEVIVAREAALSEIPHFMVADDRAYRFEPPAAIPDAGQSTIAEGNFGNPTFAASLSSFFGELVSYLTSDDHTRSQQIFSPADRTILLNPA